MTEILYIFESLGSTVFVVAALLCLAVGALGFKLDKPCVVVVSLILGFIIGHFLSMAAWNEGIGTIYLGSCIGLLSLLVSIKVRPVKRFFLGGVSMFLAVSVIVLIIANSIGGTKVTYDFFALQDGIYQETSVSIKQADLKKEMASIVGVDAGEVKAKLSEDKMHVTFEMPEANYSQLTAYGTSLVEQHKDMINSVEISSYSSWWMISLIIGAIAGIVCGILAQFKEKFMQILGTSVFAGVFGSTFAYLGLGKLTPILIAPLLAVGAFFLQKYINRNKENDLGETPAQQLPTV